MAQVPGLALIGAGLFVNDQYVGVLRSLQDRARLLYVWSRTQGAADAVRELAAEWAPPALRAVSGDAGLDVVLADPAVHAVAVVLPAKAQPGVVLKCLRAGKHVLQEKPVAGSLSEAQALLEEYHSLPSSSGPRLIWAVAENYRFEPALETAAELVRSSGKLMMTQVTVEAPMNAKNPYFSSKWRRDPSFAGAFLTDGGVHFVAGMRLITGVEPKAVAAITAHMQPALPPPDTLAASMVMHGGSMGTLAISYGATSRKVVWRSVCEAGTVEVERGVDKGIHGYFMRHLVPGQAAQEEFHPFQGVKAEIATFLSDVAKALNSADSALHPDPRGSHLEAIQDLAVVEALLQSSSSQGASFTPVVDGRAE